MARVSNAWVHIIIGNPSQAGLQASVISGLKILLVR